MERIFINFDSALKATVVWLKDIGIAGSRLNNPALKQERFVTRKFKTVLSSNSKRRVFKLINVKFVLIYIKKCFQFLNPFFAKQ